MRTLNLTLQAINFDKKENNKQQQKIAMMKSWNDNDYNNMMKVMIIKNK